MALGLAMTFEQVSSADERGDTQLHHAREANEQLVLAALSAQELRSTAEQANKRLTRQLAMVAHELRNPLMPIRTAAALMGRVRADELPRLQAIIERQVERVLGLVADLLDISRISSGKLRLQRQLVDMASIVAEAVDTCRPAMSARNQRFDVDVPAHRIEVYGDPARLVQIFSNLLDNASKYTPPGGSIALAVVATGDEVRVIVRDDGIGMAADVLPHIFGAFTQEEHAVAFNGIGLGIGLSVVHELVKAHGGSVSARSAGVDLGSEFVVTLPLAGRSGP